MRLATPAIGIGPAFFELLCATNETKNLIRDKAMDQGMRLLRQDGWFKVTQGITSVEEILRVRQE